MASFLLENYTCFVSRSRYFTELIFVDSDEIENTFSFISGTDKFFLESTIVINEEEEREKLMKELEYTEGFVNKTEKKLSNEKFVSGAPAVVVEKERKKLADGQARIKILKDTLANLN